MYILIIDLLIEFWGLKQVLVTFATSHQCGLPRTISWHVLSERVRKPCVLHPCVCPGVCVCVGVSVNKGTHMFKAGECVCMSQRERLVWSQTQWTHYPSADKCHQLQLLGGLCCRAGERGQTGVRVLLEGHRLQGIGGCREVGSQMVGGGDNTATLNETSRPPVGNPKFQHPGVHLSFPLKPLFSLIPLQSTAVLVKGQRCKTKTRHDTTLACFLGLDLHL